MSNNNFFIIESLSFENEMNLDWYEGKQLAEYLNKLSKHSAQYYYIRTQKELEFMACSFADSAFTNLFVSCHGDNKSLDLTIDKNISFTKFASIFKGKLNNKRVFFSSCEVGTQKLADEIYKNNSTIFSIMAPNRIVTFKEIFPYWIKLFYLLEEFIDQAIKKKKKDKNFKINRNLLLYEAYKICNGLGTDVNLWLKKDYEMKLQEIDQDGDYDDEYEE